MKDYGELIKEKAEVRDKAFNDKIDLEMQEIEKAKERILEHSELMDALIKNAKALRKNGYLLHNNRKGVNFWEHHEPTSAIGFAEQGRDKERGVDTIRVLSKSGSEQYNNVWYSNGEVKITTYSLSEYSNEELRNHASTRRDIIQLCNIFEESIEDFADRFEQYILSL